jgi:hypothetical protein
VLVDNAELLQALALRGDPRFRQREYAALPFLFVFGTAMVTRQGRERRLLLVSTSVASAAQQGENTEDCE